MSTSTKKRGGSGIMILLGVLLGVAVGVVIALLLAPQKGEQTREQIARQRETLRRSYQDAMEQGRQAYANAREEVLARMK